MKLTKSQKEFIGTTFPTPKGGVLTVTEVVGKIGYTPVFGLRCSICSKDEELWPVGSIKSVKGSLTKGSVPCGCSYPKWTEDQTIVRVERECKERGYVFNGWVWGYKGTNTRLDLYNPATGNRWKSTIVTNFFSGCGDVKVRNAVTQQRCVIPEERHVQDFTETGKFRKGTKFWRSEKGTPLGYKNYWHYTCPVCSNDEYVRNGLCSGVFEGHIVNLKQGYVSCRCSKNYRWTQAQREYQIHKVCKEEGYTFKGWCDGYKTSKSKLKWGCSKGHDRTSSATSFLNCGHRCAQCHKYSQKQSGIGYGYYPHRTKEPDNLYLIHFKTQNCIKVGRAFDVSSRFKGSKGLLKSSGCTIDEIEILQVLTGTHQEVYDTEQWLHEELTDRGFYHEESTWTTETFDEDCLQLLYKLVDESGLSEGEW